MGTASQAGGIIETFIAPPSVVIQILYELLHVGICVSASRRMWWFVNPGKNPDIKTFADLKKIPGKIKITTQNKGTCTELLNQKLGEKYGIPKDKFEWVTIPDIQAIQALKQGLIHVSSVNSPFYIKIHPSCRAAIRIIRGKSSAFIETGCLCLGAGINKFSAG